MPQSNIDHIQTLKRAIVACDSCFRRKIKCQRDSHPCEWCSQHNIQCTFDRGHRLTRKPHPAGLTSVFAVDTIDNTPQHDEDIGSAPSKPKSTSIPGCIETAQSGLSPQADASFRELYFAGHVPGNLRAFNGQPFFSAESQRSIALCTGESIDFEHFCSLGAPWQRQHNHGFEATKQFFNHHSHPDLPERDLLFSYLTCYQSSFANRWFPFINVSLFEYTVKTAYDNQPSIYSPHISSAKACIFGFMAFMSSFTNITRPPVDVDGRIYGHEAQYLLPEIFDSPATLDGIQTLLMISLDRLIQFGDTSSIEVLFSSATRFIFTLRGNQYQHTLQDMSVFNVHCRFLFWLAYVMDKELCMRTARPPSICDDYCDLTLPSGEEIAIEFAIPMSQVHKEHLLLFLFPTELGYSLNQSRIYTSLYSPRALRMSDTELLKTIRELDDAVEYWHNSQRLQHTSDLLVSEGLISNEEVAQRSLLLHLQRHYSVAAIHQMSTGCAAWMKDQGPHLIGINLSLDVAVDASRSLLRQFLEAPDSVQKNAFWIQIFYIVSAVMTVFCSVLRNPTGPETTNDIALLETVAKAFQILIDTQEALFLYQGKGLVKDFIFELCRLAKCATVHHRHGAVTYAQ
ncbi:hypothetical protein BDV25DRAFT_135699 [Aspergillus avenaceus]|uniref:Zn(2)-C6 fungal-type domain-containing protein n=1 Tax=Aspergillus avenaceus TaxID=36643 RepID=A0A5N6U7B0_ASPAV|nr:hypothetical protein BDV25DRAFT_135699 [Aspergillus avenaceus]